jgi:2-polyprenyl-3-methyl-5-hydroxy-6-metoxy-1,4-benzoquinol methylase
MVDRTYGDVVNDWLLRFFTPGRRVLDIGCGTGAWAPQLRRRGVQELIGVEISPESAVAASRLYDKVLTIPSEALSLSELGDRFDTMIAADVIEHLVDPFRELSRWREWCVPGGELVVSTPNLRHFRLLKNLIARGRFDYRTAVV